LKFAVFHTNKINYANGVCTVSPVTAIMVKARNTITANLIPDFCNWPQAGRGEDEGKM